MTKLKETCFYIHGGNIEDALKQYEITLAVDSDASSFALGCFLKGKGKLFLDDIELAYKEGDDWIEIPIRLEISVTILKDKTSSPS